MRFGGVVRAHRIAKGYTLERLSLMVGTQKGYISGIENGNVSPPSWKITRDICKALGLNVRKMILLGWAEKAPKIVRKTAMRMVKRG